MQTLAGLKPELSEIAAGTLFHWQNGEEGVNRIDVAVRIKHVAGNWVVGVVEYIHELGIRMDSEYGIGAEVLSIPVGELSYYDLLSMCITKGEAAFEQAQTTEGFALDGEASLPMTVYFECRVMRGVSITEATQQALLHGAKNDLAA